MDYITICELLTKNVNRDVFLPSIQREYVWKRKDSKIEKLFDSLLQKYPIGQFIIWGLTKDYLKKLDWDVYEFIKNYDEDKPHNPRANLRGVNKAFLVLDGQQRITTLNLGLLGSYKYRSYTKIKELRLYIDLFNKNSDENPDEMEYNIRLLERREVATNENEYWFEIGKVLKYFEEDTDDFKEEIEKEIYKNVQNLSEEKLVLAKKILGLIHQRICCDKIIRSEEISYTPEKQDKILDIFVRTNSAGVPLEKSDLLLAFMENDKSIFKPKNAKEEIISFEEELNNLENYKISRGDILKASLFLSGLEIRYRINNFNKKNLKDIDKNWPDIKKYLIMTVKLLKKYHFPKEAITSKNALIPIAYFLMINKKSSSFVDSLDKKDIKEKNMIVRWFILAILKRVFGSSSDTVLENIRKKIQKDPNNLTQDTGEEITEEFVKDLIRKEKKGSKLSHLLLLLTLGEEYWVELKPDQDHIFSEKILNLLQILL